VEDDTLIANAMATHLRHAGMDVEWSDRGDRAMKKLRFERPDVAIIDLMLPGMDGWRMIESLRADGIGIPLIVVSAKPFGMGELVARVKAAVRRAGVFSGDGGRSRVEVPGLVVDPDLHRALIDGRDAELTRTEFRLLSVLASEQGRVMTRDQLQQRVWGTPYRPRDRSVDVCVRKLREKLDQRSGTYSYIHTHYGVGYRFDAEPLTTAQPSSA
jgi:DNA-binding response OmpR family regulator